MKVLVNADGQFAAYGWDGAAPDDPDDTLYEMMSDKDTARAREYWLVADVPLPPVVVVPAKVVEDADA